MRQHMAALLNHATCFMYMESAFSFVPSGNTLEDLLLVSLFQT